MKTPRFAVVVLLLVVTAILLHARGDVDRVPESAPLSTMPTSIAGYTSQEIPIDQSVLDVLGKGFFLNRVYVPQPHPSLEAAVAASDAEQTGDPAAGSQAARNAVGLFIGYFPTQRTGQSIHSPQNCLPGSGWTFDSSGTTELVDGGGKHYHVGEYLISNGRARQEVLYWYQSHGRSIAGDYKAKLYMLADSIRLGRTDAALVRVITPVGSSEGPIEAHNRVVGFAQQMVPLLPAFIPN